MVNGLLGTLMWVADDRVDEYLAAGHKLADEKPKAEEKPKPKKKATKAKAK